MRGLLVALVVMSACGKNESPPPAAENRATGQESGPRKRPKNSGDATPAEIMFTTVCATCHGLDGTGNGPGAATLNPKPRNYTDPAWQASVTDDDIKAIILKGGSGVGKSPMMPPSPQLAEDPTTLAELVKIIRAFGPAKK